MDLWCPPASSPRQASTCVILGLVPRIHLAASAGASGGVDGRDKPDHDNAGINSQLWLNLQSDYDLRRAHATDWPKIEPRVRVLAAGR